MTPEAMAALHGQCFTTPRPWTTAEIAGLLADPHVFALQVPQGFLMGRVVAGEAELLTLAVDPAARRQGTGRQLVAGFLAEAARRGAESAFLEVAFGNAAARALYAAAGFAPAGTRRGYYHRPDGSREDALILVRAIEIPS